MNTSSSAELPKGDLVGGGAAGGGQLQDKKSNLLFLVFGQCCVKF